MTLEQAKDLIRETTNAMDILYGGTVFDELAIVSLVRRRMHLAWYTGPRQEGFVSGFNRDTAALRAETRARLGSSQQYHVGDFQFIRDGVGTQAESFIRLGETAFLICGNTRLSMADIAKNSKWLAAQKPFANMCDRFRLNPLELQKPAEGPDLGTF